MTYPGAIPIFSSQELRIIGFRDGKALELRALFGKTISHAALSGGRGDR